MSPEGFPLSRLVDRAPEIKLSPRALEKAVSWDSEKNEPITLGAFIAARAPEAARKLGIPQREEPGTVKRFDELTEDEQRLVAITRLSQGPDELVLRVDGHDYTHADIIAEIQAGSAFGQNQLRKTLQGIALIEQLAERGKIVSAPEENKPPVLPDFPF